MQTDPTLHISMLNRGCVKCGVNLYQTQLSSRCILVDILDNRLIPKLAEAHTAMAHVVMAVLIKDLSARSNPCKKVAGGPAVWSQVVRQRILQLSCHSRQ